MSRAAFFMAAAGISRSRVMSPRSMPMKRRNMSRCSFAVVSENVNAGMPLCTIALENSPAAAGEAMR